MNTAKLLESLKEYARTVTVSKLIRQNLRVSKGIGQES